VVQPRSILAVLDSSSRATNGAVAKARSLAEWYDAALHVVADRSVRAIGDAARHFDPDLIVVGRDERRGGSRLFAGSFAAAIGKAANRPTIAVPHDHRPSAASRAPFRNIVAGVDFSEASFRALSDALVLAQESGGRLTLLHVLDGVPYQSVFSASRALRLVRGLGARVERVNRELSLLVPPDAFNWADIDVATMSGTAPDVIVSAAVDRRADLVVLGLPQRPRVEEFVAPSTVEGVVRRADVPLLLVPGPSLPNPFRQIDEADAVSVRHPAAFG
jgi:nucleotide-binding universal stress UspA family protein